MHSRLYHHSSYLYLWGSYDTIPLRNDIRVFHRARESTVKENSSKIFRMLVALFMVGVMSVPYGGIAIADDSTDVAQEATKQVSVNQQQTETDNVQSSATDVTDAQPDAVASDGTASELSSNSPDVQTDITTADDNSGDSADGSLDGDTTLLPEAVIDPTGTYALAPQNYAPSRSVIGTPLGTYTEISEGGVSAHYSFHRGAFENVATTDTVTYRAEYHLPTDTMSAGTFSHTYFVIVYNFGYGTSVWFDKNDPSTWPANFQTGLNIIKWTDDTVIMEYTFSAADIQWCKDNPSVWQIAVAPAIDHLKMPSTVEAAYFSCDWNVLESDKTTGQTIMNRDSTRPRVSDKRTVEIDEQIAPVGVNGVGTYTTDKVYLAPGQKGSVQVTLSRPVGVTTSGDCEVNCTIPDGMTYVNGSAAATSSSGIAVTVDDSSGSPKVDFSALPVGDTVTLTYQVKAPDSVDDYTEFPTSDTLTNLYQKNLVGNIHNSILASQNVYTQSEYDTTTSSTFVMGMPLDKSLTSVVYNTDGTATASYVVTLSNTTSSAITDCVLSDSMTGGTIDASSVSGATWDPTTKAFTVANVPAAAGDVAGTASFSYTATINDPSRIGVNPICAATSAWALDKLRVTGDDSTSAATGPLQVGDDVWYLVTIDNSTSDSSIPASASKVTDTFSNLDYVGAEATQGDFETSGSTLTWNVGEVAGGSKAQAWVHFTVDSSALTDAATPFTVVNKASTVTHSVIAQDPVSHVTLTKSVDAATVRPGDTITYTLTATNDGAAAAVGYWVKDYLPADTTYVSSDGDYGTAASGAGYVNWFFSSIALGETKTMTMKVKVGGGPDMTFIDNMAQSQVTAKSTPPSDMGGTDPSGEVSNTVTVEVIHETMPLTGDTSGGFIGMLIILAAGAACLLMSRRRVHLG